MNKVECITVYYTGKIHGHHIKVVRDNSVRRYRYSVARATKLHNVTIARGWKDNGQAYLDGFAVDIYPPERWAEIAPFVS